MNKSQLRKLAGKVHLQINDTDLAFFEESFSAVLPMVSKLLAEKVAASISPMERIILTPLEMTELSRLRHQSQPNILSSEEIRKNALLGKAGIVVSKKAS